MSPRTALSIAALCLVTGLALGQEQPLIHNAAGALPPAAPDAVVPDEFVVVFSPAVAPQVAARAAGPATGIAALDDLGQVLGVTRVREQFPGADADRAQRAGLPDLSGYFVVKFDARRISLDDAMAAYVADPSVLRVEKIGIHAIHATPNDGNYASQWHLNQANDHDIDAPEGWNIETGDPQVIVAVLDTGVRYYHKDLGGANASSANPGAADGNMWVNWAEKNGTPGVDDDGNGYVDDWIGWDWVTGVTGCWSGEDCSTADNDPRDFNGHGTHCAGNVGAINNNGYATCAAAGGWGNGTLQPTGNGVKVLACRIGWSGSYLGQEVGYVRMDFAASAFYYAANMGARVATCSWGSSNSGGIDAAVSYFTAAGGLVFKSAGNSNNQTADFLCARSDVYSVAATDQNDVKASFSSYGTWVDISAPGVSIYSLYHSHANPSADYVAAMSGTSMASPVAASVAAAIWSQNLTWTAAQVWARLRDTADDIDAFNPAYVGKLGSGRVNLYNAVNSGPVNNPPTVTITAPPDGTTVTEGTAITFTGTATDPEDGDISASLVWTSNLQGQIGTGASFTRTLNVGTHAITASVTDSGGLSGSDVVTVIVQSASTPPAAPTNCTAVGIKGGQARVSWVDNANNEDGFELERQQKVGKVYTNTTIIRIATPNTTTYTDSPGAGKFRYRVRAYKGTLVSESSNWANVTVR
ncbi:MAG: S8 family serine peptidase [Planctomycetota bacterium]